MSKNDRNAYVGELSHNKKRPPPNPSTQPRLAPPPTDSAQAIAAKTSVSSSLVRESRRAKDRGGAGAASRAPAGQLDELRPSSVGLQDQSKSNEKMQALQVTMADA